MTGRQRPPRRAIDGVLLLDKPASISSQGAVTRVKILFNAAKAGHTGTLDPMATGLLPVALGEATKFSNTLLDAPKAYRATVRLGQTTTTGDLEGEVVATAPVEGLTPERIQVVLARFRGEIVQVPPMYSALKFEGRPLYAYARKGMEIERTPRRVHVAKLELITSGAGELVLDILCSKGTYVRVLATDIGEALGCGACLAALRRTGVGPFAVEDAIALPALEDMTPGARETRLLPADAMLTHLPVARLDGAAAQRVTTGLAVDWDRTSVEGVVRLFGPGDAFLGVADAHGGRLQPRRLVAQKSRES